MGHRDHPARGNKLTLVPVLGSSSGGGELGSDAIPDVWSKAVGTFTGRYNVDKMLPNPRHFLGSIEKLNKTKSTT